MQRWFFLCCVVSLWMSPDSTHLLKFSSCQFTQSLLLETLFTPHQWNTKRIYNYRFFLYRQNIEFNVFKIDKSQTLSVTDYPTFSLFFAIARNFKENVLDRVAGRDCDRCALVWRDLSQCACLDECAPRRRAPLITCVSPPAAHTGRLGAPGPRSLRPP